MPLTTTTTGHDIVEMAYARLMDVSPENIATEEEELRLLVNRSLDSLFAVGARVNPAFYGKVATLVAEEDADGEEIGWLRPKDAESVFRVEFPDGIEVAVVPFDQRHIEPHEPTLYTLGQYYRAAMPDLAPVWGSLNFWYARRPEPLEDLTDTLDPMWPEAFNELLALEVAIHLALKSGQQQELAHLREERNGQLARYVAFLQHETQGALRAWSTIKRMPGSLFALLAGGGS